MKAGCILVCIPHKAGSRSREGILCLRYGPSRRPSRAGRSSAGLRGPWRLADGRGSVPPAAFQSLSRAFPEPFQGPQPPQPRAAALDLDMAELRAGSRPPPPGRTKDGGSAHAPWLALPFCPPPLYGRPRCCLGARGGAPARAPRWWRGAVHAGPLAEGAVTWPRAARRQRLGAVSSRPSGASAGAAPPPRHPRPLPARRWAPGAAGGTAAHRPTERARERGRAGTRRRRLGRPRGGGTAGAGARPLGRGGRSLAGEAARAWNGAWNGRAASGPCSRGPFASAPAGTRGSPSRRARRELSPAQPLARPGPARSLPGRLALRVGFLLFHVGETDHARKRDGLRQGSYCPYCGLGWSS